MCVDGLLALTRQGLFLSPISCCVVMFQRIVFLFIEMILNFAEFLNKDFGSRDQEADVLIQVIMSIKSIIKQDPPSHEKVFCSLL